LERFVITAGVLEARNRMRADAPLVVVVTRRRAQPSDDAVRFITAAARDLDVDALSLDADDAETAPLLDELGVRVIPEVMVLSRGVLLERTIVASAEDARAVLGHALRRQRKGI
jgi:electron transfer flavoprotein alpha/beta subunit